MKRNTLPEKKEALTPQTSGLGLQTIVESILFLENTFVAIDVLCKKTGARRKEIQKCIQKTNLTYTQHGHPFVVAESEGSYILTIKKEISSQLEAVLNGTRAHKMSSALLETLSIVAYAQPITKAEIYLLRGVNPDSTLRALLHHDLIRVVGKRPIPGTPNEYGTTDTFLRTFGFSKIEELPRLSGHKKLPFAQLK